MSLWAFILYVLLLSWARSHLVVGLSFFNPSLKFFAGQLTPMPCHPVVPAMLLFDLCLRGLLWACYMLSFCSILVAQYHHWADTHALLGILIPFPDKRVLFCFLAHRGIPI